MIVVIADDFTGAAEIGGIGLRYQMRVEIATAVDANSTADLLVIATDNRSKTTGEAVAEIRQMIHRLGQLTTRPKYIYKKVDSVLRGHIIAELAAQMELSGKKQALIVPANPQMGRTIENGIYYIKGKKLQETGFRKDPEFAATSSDVVKLLEGERSGRPVVAKPEETLPGEGIVIGEAATVEDLRLWADKVDDSMVTAGAAGFFSALLEKKGFSRAAGSTSVQSVLAGKKALFVCGSSFASSKQIIEETVKAGGPVSLMPAALTTAVGDHLSSHYWQWASEIIALFRKHDHVMISTDPRAVYEQKEQPGILRTNMGITVEKVVGSIELQELMLEGGSTASAVLKALGWERFYPKQELAGGVIRMGMPGNQTLHITLKPGSYEWPAFLWSAEQQLKNK